MPIPKSGTGDSPIGTPKKGDVKTALTLYRRDMDENQHGAAAWIQCARPKADRQSSTCHWKALTFLATLRHDRIDTPWVFDEPINGETFKAYVEHILAAIVPQTTRSRISDKGCATRRRSRGSSMSEKRSRSGFPSRTSKARLMAALPIQAATRNHPKRKQGTAVNLSSEPCVRAAKHCKRKSPKNPENPTCPATCEFFTETGLKFKAKTGLTSNAN
jgi:hypothetical protein